ncbi:MAG: hypothetical protein PHW31_03800 [Candidatus Pacebacteria bacterium]|nr:hypothetical protein [Candidatus Paceibacterota bacterium]
MPYDFYQSEKYHGKQSELTKENWKKGIFNFHYKKEKRICLRDGCNNYFEVIPSDKKVYCCSSCFAKVNNAKRGPMAESIKLKISRSLKGRTNSHIGRGITKIEIVCANPRCQKIFFSERWRHRKYCSNDCVMAVIGGKPTSPKSSKGKGGVRADIDSNIYFYSRWEANFARLLNFFNIKWEYQSKTFDLIIQKYTPDFYLPECKTYIEIKNFLWTYSAIRDKKFRELYPETRLILLLKENYLILEKQYGKNVSNWEFRSTPFVEN